MKNDALQDVLTRREELHADLQPYVVDHPSLGQMLQHPLAYQIPYFPQSNALINLQYQHKLEMLDAARKAKDWDQVIGLHERAYRWEALDALADQLTDEQLAQSFAWVWIDSENIWQNHEIIEGLIPRIRNQAFRPYLMDRVDLKRFAALPTMVHAYRGCQQHNRRGLSWTLDRDKAIWFAKRYTRNGDKPLLLSAEIAKPDILFYSIGRNEDEIVLSDPDSPQSIKPEPLQ